MARAALQWSYSADVLKLKLTANELALLRALCWKHNPKINRTDPLTNADLTHLTAIRSAQTLYTIRTHLYKQNLISYEHANIATKRRFDHHVQSRAYVYCVHYKEVIS